tara:strand:+ start:487 stop:1629 length:1143 start_codon:yes stop_codon:yes gene_type:complete
MLRCRGKCGKEGCEYETTDRTTFEIHTIPEAREDKNAKKRKRVNCDICGVETSQACLGEHKKINHGIQRRTYLRCPPEFDKNEFAFVKKLVRNCIQEDMKHMSNWSEKDQQDLRDIDNNESRHKLAIDVFNRYNALGDIDENGGRITGKCKIVLFPHSLFSLSLRWKDHTKPHFVNNSLDNTLLTIKGMNPTSDLYKWASLGGDGSVCEQLRREMQREVTDEMVQEALEREKMSMSTASARRFNQSPRHNVLYMSVRNMYNHDSKAKKAFENSRKMFTYVYELYRAALARGSVCDIFMSGHAYNQLSKGRHPHPFQPSIDAIDPTKGHVKGNLRVICAFLNSQDFSKINKYKDLKEQEHGEIPHSWTRELWYHYVGMNAA